MVLIQRYEHQPHHDHPVLVAIHYETRHIEDPTRSISGFRYDRQAGMLLRRVQTFGWKNLHGAVRHRASIES